MLRVFTDRRCLDHRPPFGFPERPERLEVMLEELARRGREIVGAGPRADAREAVLAVHAEGYVERLRRAIERGDGLIDSADNPLSPGTWDAAWGAVEATLAAAEWMQEGEGRVAFAAVRPPGHHAERSVAMGFCYLNSVAVAAQWLRAERGVERVAIFDFDVHHGNGTQHLFEDRADVFYASIHQYPFYPGTGAAGERGRGPGRGATLNVPLPAGSGDAEYAAAFDDRVLPALREFAPVALLLSAGFDAWRGDPVGAMRVTRRAYQEWGVKLRALADGLCGGRVLAVFEGGYDLASLGPLAEAHLRGLEGQAPPEG